MIRNYIKIAWRNILKNKMYSFINIGGLAVGMAVAMLIGLWIWDELSIDSNYDNANRMFKVMVNSKYPDGKIETYPATPSRLKKVIENEIPEIEIATQHSFESELLLNYENNNFTENGIYADSAFFKVLNFKFIYGNKELPFKDVNSIAISKSLSEKLFKNVNPIGKTIIVAQKYNLEVNSVFEDVPLNSSIRFDYIIPFKLFLKENPWTQNWGSGATNTIVLLKRHASVDKVNSKIANIITKNCKECTTSPFLYPFSKLRLHNVFENGINVGGRISQVYLLGIIAIFILVMACINFINISIAKSSVRKKEVGIRKAIGALKSGLASQFIGEALLHSFLASILCLFLVMLLLPIFKEVTEKNISIANPFVLFAFFLLTVITGLLSGSYPAFILSKFNPTNAINGNSSTETNGNSLRKMLVVVQFTITVILAICSTIVYQQMDFIHKKNLGFNKSNILVINQNEGIVKNYEAIKNEISQLPFVQNIAFGGNNVFTMPITSTDPIWRNKPTNSSLNFKIFRCDHAFIPTMQIKLITGRNFNGKGDSANYIINTKAMKTMGYSLNNVIGQELTMWNGKGKIVGLTDDFHNDNLQSEIQPLIFMYSENMGLHYFIRLNDGLSSANQASQIMNIFKKNNPAYPFDYTLLDDVFKNEYKSESLLSKLAFIFTIVGFFISFLGLFGLASFVAEQRTKEIGIRKVLGATVVNLWQMLSKDFVILVIISCLIATPIAYYFMHEWLQKYTYRTEISWWIFVAAGAGALIITLLTVSYQAIKAALMNPVKSLKTE
jgi:putative ABC transport system permease protein